MQAIAARPVQTVLLNTAEVLAHVEILVLFCGEIEEIGVCGLDAGQPVALTGQLQVRLASLLDRQALTPVHCWKGLVLLLGVEVHHFNANLLLHERRRVRAAHFAILGRAGRISRKQGNRAACHQLVIVWLFQKHAATLGRPFEVVLNFALDALHPAGDTGKQLRLFSVG